jgi:hypothetical protein
LEKQKYNTIKTWTFHTLSKPGRHFTKWLGMYTMSEFRASFSKPYWHNKTIHFSLTKTWSILKCGAIYTDEMGCMIKERTQAVERPVSTIQNTWQWQNTFKQGHRIQIDLTLAKLSTTSAESLGSTYTKTSTDRCYQICQAQKHLVLPDMPGLETWSEHLRNRENVSHTQTTDTTPGASNTCTNSVAWFSPASSS